MKVFWKIFLSIAAVISIAGGVLCLIFGAGAFDNPHSEADYRIADDTVVLFKNPNKDFKILNLTDTQVGTLSDWLLIDEQYHADKQLYATMKEVIEKEQPDLITITGDLCWMVDAEVAFRKLVDFIDGYGIPWAPVLGNHDLEGADLPLDKYVEILQNTENCLFQRGPETASGCGNYVINIVEQDRIGNSKGKIVESLIMLDSHASAPEGGYDYIKSDQIEWYTEVVGKLNELNGSAVESTLFFHIPLPEFDAAYNMWEASNFDPSIGFGVMRESVSDSHTNSGLFEVVKSLGSTKNIVCGHDHVNNFSILYEGVRLTYGLKTGDRCYADDDLNGGTVITIGSNGVESVCHSYSTITA